MAQLLDPEQWGRGPGRPDTGAGDGSDGRPPGPRRTGSTPAAGVPTASAAPAAPVGSGASSTSPDWDPSADDPPARREPGGRPPAGERSSSRLPMILAVVLVVLALVAGGVWAVASGLVPLGGGPQAPAPETPAASAPSTGEPQPSESPAAPAEPAGAALPASCDEVYSESMRGTIEGAGLLLNPGWYVASGDERLPSEDGELQEILGAAQRLDCTWAQESAGEVAIFTSVSSVSEVQAAAAEARMIELGYGAIEELGGVRYVTETSGDGNTLGESHFLRDGLWFGTLWVNYGPAGYTADMVTQVLG